MVTVKVRRSVTLLMTGVTAGNCAGQKERHEALWSITDDWCDSW